MKLKFAFAGFRHGHITVLHEKVKKHPSCQLVAACEEDADARKNAREIWKIELTHESFKKMLEEVDFDVLAVGDYYSRRGQLIIAALKAGKHVISDKPICTSLDELEEISRLSGAKNLKIGCMLDLRDNPNMYAAKQIVSDGRLGEIHAIQFGGQHPLMLGTRPGWYFEKGRHGGTLNDIAIHGLDLVEWLTGLEIAEIVAARTWNAFAGKFPHFKDAGQLMLKLSNNCGVTGDVSYFSPDSFGYKLPYYWRVTVWGRNGVIEFNYVEPGVRVALNGADVISVTPPVPAEIDFLDSFLKDVSGNPVSLNTGHVLNISGKTLKLQKMADECCNKHHK
ncbi:MAG: Gfo/Idh/MocA family oxidoreductase [Victivallales bacterium]